MKAMQVLKNKKGFTLIEIIVVLIILAILAATGIPSLIGFIDEARGKAYVAEARATYIAVQMLVTEDASLPAASQKIDNTDAIGDINGNAAYLKRLTDMLAPDITYNSTATPNTITALTVDSGRVTGMIYQNSGYYVKMKPGSTAEVKRNPASGDSILSLP